MWRLKISLLIVVICGFIALSGGVTLNHPSIFRALIAAAVLLSMIILAGIDGGRGYYPDVDRVIQRGIEESKKKESRKGKQNDLSNKIS